MKPAGRKYEERRVLPASWWKQEKREVHTDEGQEPTLSRNVQVMKWNGHEIRERNLITLHGVQ
jgi:hypothetical protein